MKNKRKLAQVYLDLDAIYVRLQKLVKDAPADERDALMSAKESVSDACGVLTYIVDAKVLEAVKGKS